MVTPRGVKARTGVNDGSATQQVRYTHITLNSHVRVYTTVGIRACGAQSVGAFATVLGRARGETING